MLVINYNLFLHKFANESKFLLSIIRRRFGDLNCHMLRFTRETKSQNNEKFYSDRNFKKKEKTFTLSSQIYQQL